MRHSLREMRILLRGDGRFVVRRQAFNDHVRIGATGSATDRAIGVVVPARIRRLWLHPIAAQCSVVRSPVLRDAFPGRQMILQQRSTKRLRLRHPATDLPAAWAPCETRRGLFAETWRRCDHRTWRGACQKSRARRGLAAISRLVAEVVGEKRTHRRQPLSRRPVRGLPVASRREACGWIELLRRDSVGQPLKLMMGSGASCSRCSAPARTRDGSRTDSWHAYVR